MSSQEIVAVRPLGWEDEPEEQHFELSAFDQLMPRIYVPIVLIYKLPAQFDAKKTIENLRRGLEVALARYPVLAGIMQNKEDNTLFVLRRKEHAVNLTINHMDDAAFPSYDKLDEKDFPVAMLDGEKLIPKAATDVRFHREHGPDEDTFVSAVQVNFITGGLILGLAVSHNVSDGPGCDGFLSTWAEISRALDTGMSLPPFDPVNLDRSRLSSKSNPDAARMKMLHQEVPAFTHRYKIPAPPLPDDFIMPKVDSVMWHFPMSKIRKLKELCKPEDAKSWVSTYDCIMGLLYKTMTRARAPMLKLDTSSPSVMMHAVNNRQMLDPPLPDRFMGSAVSIADTGRLQLQDVIGLSLAQAAALVRSSIRRITPEHIGHLAEWVAGTPDKAWIGLDFNFFLGPDVAATSWMSMSSYKNHDFGFGLPQAVRWPRCEWEGFIFVYPRRVKDDPEEGLECCVYLEEGCQERLMRDSEILQFASPRGL